MKKNQEIVPDTCTEIPQVAYASLLCSSDSDLLRTSAAHHDREKNNNARVRRARERGMQNRCALADKNKHSCHHEKLLDPLRTGQGNDQCVRMASRTNDREHCS